MKRSWRDVDLKRFRRYNLWSTIFGTLLFAWGLLRLATAGDVFFGVLLIVVGSGVALWTVALRIDGMPGLLYAAPRGEVRRDRELWRPRVVHFYTRKGCSLCLEARIRLERDLAGKELTIVDHDVDQDVVLQRRHGDRVPVAVFEGGEVFALEYDEAAVRSI